MKGKRLPPLDSVRGPAKQLTKLADLVPDERNARSHTERGLGMLEHSLRRYGAGRSILVDRQGRVIAGNATLERAADLGMDIEVVRSHGEKLIVVQREDLDLSDDGNADAREMAIADNRTAELSDWNSEVLSALQDADTDLTAFFLDDELASLLASGGRKQKVAFDAETKTCTCCQHKCRKGCGCFAGGTD